jgi:hypothetical protein
MPLTARSHLHVSMGEFDVPLYAGIGAVAFCFFCLGLYLGLCVLRVRSLANLLPSRLLFLACWGSFYLVRRRWEHGPSDIEAASPTSPASERATPPPYPRVYYSSICASTELRSIKGASINPNLAIGVHAPGLQKNSAPQPYHLEVRLWQCHSRMFC